MLNPAHTLEILKTAKPAPVGTLQVNYEDSSYYIPDNESDSWNQEMFRLLYQLFQMTVTEVSGVHVPRITIAK